MILLIWRIPLVFLLSALFVFVMGCRAVGTISPTSASTSSAPNYVLYGARVGETPAQIAARFHTTIEQLIALNFDRYPVLARDPSQLQPGWRLRVPADSVSPVQATAAAVQQQSDLDTSVESIVVGINAARAQRGTPLLRSEVVLTRMANDRGRDMIARDYFSHYDPQTGQEPLLRYLQAYGYAYQYAGENTAEIKNGSDLVLPWLAVAARYRPDKLASKFVTDWLNSPEHRALIFNSNYRRTGVGISVNRDGSCIVAVQVFSD